MSTQFRQEISAVQQQSQQWKPSSLHDELAEIRKRNTKENMESRIEGETSSSAKAQCTKGSCKGVYWYSFCTDPHELSGTLSRSCCASLNFWQPSKAQTASMSCTEACSKHSWDTQTRSPMRTKPMIPGPSVAQRRTLQTHAALVSPPTDCQSGRIEVSLERNHTSGLEICGNEVEASFVANTNIIIKCWW